MKRRWTLFVVAGVTCAMAGAWWTGQPVRPRLAPELAAHLVPQNLVPGDTYVDPAPPGMVWEIYGVPMAFDRVVRTMGAEAGWRSTGPRAPSEFTQASFIASEGIPFRVDVAPGVIAIVDVTQPPNVADDDLGNRSVVMVAVPNERSISRRMVEWVERWLGRGPAPPPNGSTVVYSRVDPPGAPRLP